MEPDYNEDLPRIDDAINPVRAAIEMVASGSARRVTLHSIVGAQLLPAARLLARAAGVTVEATWSPAGAVCDLVVTSSSGADG
jgi:hypothetical protein